MPPTSLIPSSFLPHLPRSQSSFDPIPITDISGHIAILRELYIPPVHGGFEVADCLVDEDDLDDEAVKERKERSMKRERRFSAGLVETMDGLGLGLDVPPKSAGQTSGPSVDLDDLLEYDESGNKDESVQGEESREHLDPFERDWSEKWLNGVVRRSQGWLEDHEGQEDVQGWKEMEAVLKDASAALAMMAGTSATGSLTRHLLFPLDPSLEPGLRATRPSLLSNPALSPAAHTFLSSLATSPTSPLTLKRHMGSSPESQSHISSSPTNSINDNGNSNSDRNGNGRKRKRIPAVPVLLHDAPMSDHLSVGVQTWGSAILLGRRMAKFPDQFGLFQPGVRILELGAGTGLLSILCRKLIDLKHSTDAIDGKQTTSSDVIVATDFLPEVLANLKTCIDLNFPTASTGINISKLDWSTFPQYMSSRHSVSDPNGIEGEEEETSQYMDEPFDLVLASDCVYDETHARMLHEVVIWTLRLPDPKIEDDIGGTFHILSPIRPTFTPELESIDTHFPPHPLPTTDGKGEGLGAKRGLRIGTRGSKKGMVGRRGEGRIDENAGYWWWEVGWA